MAKICRPTSSLLISIVQQTVKEEVSTNLTDYAIKSTAQNLIRT